MMLFFAFLAGFGGAAFFDALRGGDWTMAGLSVVFILLVILARYISGLHLEPMP